MSTNKERIEQLEANVGGLQYHLSQMEIGVADKFHVMKETLR